MVKYKPRHEWVKQYIPKGFQDVADSATDHLGGVINKLSFEDILKLALWGALTSEAYDIVKDIKPAIYVLPSIGLVMGGISRTVVSLFLKLEKKEEVNVHALIYAMFGAYLAVYKPETVVALGKSFIDLVKFLIL